MLITFGIIDFIIGLLVTISIANCVFEYRENRRLKEETKGVNS